MRTECAAGCSRRGGEKADRRVHAGEVDQAEAARGAGAMGAGEAVDHNVLSAAERLPDEGEDGRGEASN